MGQESELAPITKSRNSQNATTHTQKNTPQHSQKEINYYKELEKKNKKLYLHHCCEKSNEEFNFSSNEDNPHKRSFMLPLYDKPPDAEGGRWGSNNARNLS